MGTISDKLTYLDETRENIRQSINSIGGNLTNSDTFRSYSDAIDEIYEKFPKVEGTGSNITLENTMEASIKSELNGNTTQSGTPTPDSPIPVNVVSGRQDIVVNNKNYLVPYNESNVGVDISTENYTMTINGTSTGGSNFAWSSNFYLKAGTYRINTKYVSGTINNNVQLIFRKYNSNENLLGLTFGSSNYQNNRNETFVLDEDTYVRYTAYVGGSGRIYDNFKFNIQLTQSASADYNFEPYTGQSYEINLGNIELCKINTYKDMIFRSKGVNLFDGSIYKENVVISSTGVESYNGNFNLYKMYLKPNTTYTIQFKSTDTTVRSSRYIAYKSNDTFIEMVKEFTYDTNESVVQTFTTPNETSYVLFHIGKLISNLMINEGSTALPYEPYNSKGKWLLHKEIGKAVLDGSESWNTHAYGTNSYELEMRQILSNGSKITTLSNLFKGIPYDDRATSGNNIIYKDLLNTLIVRNTNITTLSDFKTLLSNSNLILYYVLATPTTTEITDTELIEQLEEFGDAKSYEGTTNINVDGDLPIILNVKALEDIFSQ